MKKYFTLLFFLLWVPAFTALCPKDAPQIPSKKATFWLQQEKELVGKDFRPIGSLATVSSEGYPNARMVELARISRKGITIFTHKNATKVQHLSTNPHFALNIWLPKTQKQICIKGVVSQIPPEEAEKIWKKVPRYMKLQFIASNHEGEIKSLDILRERKNYLEEFYKDTIPMPEHFLGYQLIPDHYLFYEMQPRDFSLKQIAYLTKSGWKTKQIEP